MPATDPGPVRPASSPRLARPVPSFEPVDPLDRALNRIKGDGRRNLVAGLAAAGVPLSRVPRILLRENLTAFEHSAFWRTGAFSLLGEWLPDLLPGEVEEARLHWSLPRESRVIALRARPHRGGAFLRLVDDLGGVYGLPRTWSPCPVTDRDVVALLDGAWSDWFPSSLGVFRSAWEEARRLGFGRKQIREAVAGRAMAPGRRLKPHVDEIFERFEQTGAGVDAIDDDAGHADPEVVQ